MISLCNVSLEYPIPRRYRDLLTAPFRPPRKKAAIRDITLTIAAGERVGILGPNGAGKTTLLKLIGGLVYPSHGTTSVAGYDTIRDNPKVRASVGYVINEERSFYWRLTGPQNLRYFAALEDMFGTEARTRIALVLRTVGLEETDDRPVSHYSAGMRQRLAIARGLLRDPDVLLLDEPTKSLDLLGAESVRRLLAGSSTVHRARTLLLTTNQLDDVANVCDRICIIEAGRLVAVTAVGSDSRETIAALYRTSVSEGHQ